MPLFDSLISLNSKSSFTSIYNPVTEADESNQIRINFLGGLVKAVKSVGSKVGGAISKGVSKVVSKGASIAKSVGRKVVSTAKSVGKSISSGAKKAVGVVKKSASAIWKRAKSVGSKVLDKAKSFGKKAFGSLKSIGSKVWDKAKSFGGKVWDKAKSLSKKAWDGAKSIGRGLSAKAKGLWERAKTAARSIGRTASNVWGTIRRTGSNAWNAIRRSPIGRAVSSGWRGIQRFGRSAGQFVRQLPGRVSNFARSLPGRAWQGVRSVGHQVGQFGNGFYHAIADPAKMIWNLTGRAVYDPRGALRSWSDVGKGLVYGIRNPLEFGKALINWQDLKSGNIARWLGGIAPAIIGAAASGGGSTALSTTSRFGKLGEFGSGLISAVKGPFDDLRTLSQGGGAGLRAGLRNLRSPRNIVNGFWDTSASRWSQMGNAVPVLGSLGQDHRNDWLPTAPSLPWLHGIR